MVGLNDKKEVVKMTEEEIYTFMKKMEEIGDVWKKTDVERVYGKMSLEDALQDRMTDINWFADIISKVAKR